MFYKVKSAETAKELQFSSCLRPNEFVVSDMPLLVKLNLSVKALVVVNQKLKNL